MAKKPGKFYIDAAEKAPNITVKHGDGDHYKFYGTQSGTNKTEMMVCPYKLVGNGTEHAIRKFLIRMGVAISLFGISIAGLIMMTMI